MAYLFIFKQGQKFSSTLPSSITFIHIINPPQLIPLNVGSNI